MGEAGPHPVPCRPPMGDRLRDKASGARRSFMPTIETLLRLGLALFFLYVFLVGVKSLETGIASLGSDAIDRIFGSVANPIAGLAAGILATVLVQSSSVSTATIVGLVGSGLLPFGYAIPMIMGANIGTTVTNTLASLGHVRQSAYFERALAAATMHDYFNLLTVLVLLPLEILFGLISNLAMWLAGIFDGLIPDVQTGRSPIKDAVSAPVTWVHDLLAGLGWGVVEGTILLGVGFALIFVSLWLITRNMRAVMSGRIENAINGILGKGAGFGALIAGILMTVAVQSSSITTSILVPLVAAGVLSLRNAFPVTLGANVGTTVTALLASVAAESPDALIVAVAHLVFNVLGILIFYPWLPLRRLPLRLATWTAAAAVKRKSLVAGYVVGLFIVAPLLVLLIA
jgi:solute carrier family 34 (sodium-dependent phosphate cotransporter)